MPSDRVEDSFLKAFEKHSDELFRHCYFRVSDRERALDIVQDTFLRTWNYLRGGGEIRQYRAFLFKTLNNLIIDEYRRKRTVSLDMLLEDETISRDMFEELQSGSREEEEFRFDASQVKHLLDELPEPYKEVVVMRFIDGLAPKEIAALLEESENVVSVRIHRGILWLRKHMPQ